MNLDDVSSRKCWNGVRRAAVKTQKIRGPQIHKHMQFDQIKWALEVFPMGYKFLKENKKILVLEKGHWWNKMTVGISHLA